MATKDRIVVTGIGVNYSDEQFDLIRQNLREVFGDDVITIGPPVRIYVIKKEVPDDDE